MTPKKLPNLDFTGLEARILAWGLVIDPNDPLPYASGATTLRNALLETPMPMLPNVSNPDLWTILRALNHAYSRIDDLSEDGISEDDKNALQPAQALLQGLLWKDLEDDSRPG